MYRVSLRLVFDVFSLLNGYMMFRWEYVSLAIVPVVFTALPEGLKYHVEQSNICYLYKSMTSQAGNAILKVML